MDVQVKPDKKTCSQRGCAAWEQEDAPPLGPTARVFVICCLAQEAAGGRGGHLSCPGRAPSDNQEGGMGTAPSCGNRQGNGFSPAALRWSLENHKVVGVCGFHH